MPPRNLTTALETATRTFVTDIIDLLRQATIDDLMELGRGEPVPADQVEEPVAEVPARQAVAEPLVEDEAPARPSAKPRKTRSWPTCSTSGCGVKMYGPSWSKRLCYQHHLASRGEAVAVRQEPVEGR